MGRVTVEKKDGGNETLAIVGKFGLWDGGLAGVKVPVKIIAKFNRLGVTEIADDFPSGFGGRFIHKDIFAWVRDPGHGLAPRGSFYGMPGVFPGSLVDPVAATIGVVDARGEVDVIGRKILSLVLRASENIGRFNIRVQRTT